MQWLSRLWIALLTALCLSALLALTFNIWPGIPVRNNIMHLLPALRDDVVLRDALERSNAMMSRKLLLMVGAEDDAVGRRAVLRIKESLAAQDFFSPPVSGMDAQQAQAIGAFYYQWRAGLLSDAQRALLQKNDNNALLAQLTQTVFSPVSGFNAALLANDPLLQFYGFMRSLPLAQGHIQSVDGELVVRSEGKIWRVLLVDIRRDTFDMAFHPQYQQWRDHLQQDFQHEFPEAELLLMGAVQHAVWGASSAKHEVSTIGNGSLAGIIVLMLVVFRGARALLASLLPLATGVVAGLVVTLWVDGEIHLITLVFGSSVIGVAMDYSLHYLAEHYKISALSGGERYSSLRRVFPGITYAMITSAIAYASIGFAPFPVLRQIAIFSCTGLFMAWFTVVSLYSHMLPVQRYHTQVWLQWSERFDAALRRLFDWKGSGWLIALLALSMLPGLLHLQANDDLRLLQTPEPGIIAMEKRVQQITGFEPNGRFFLVEGSDIEQLLQRTEKLTQWLGENHYRADAITRYLPSQQRQQENFSLQRLLFSSVDHGEESFAVHWQKTLGFAPAVTEKMAALFSSIPQQWLQFSDIEATPLAPQLQRYQLTRTERGYISAVYMQGSPDFAILREQTADPAWQQQFAGAHWMDPVSDISALFKHYREQSAWMMLIAYSVIAVLLGWRYGLRAGWHVLLAPLLAAWITLGLLGYAGVAINLFHVLALLLTLGVGIDYSIFFAESGEHRDSTMLAVLLSTITTLLSFGLLALSQTAAISSFGTVVSIGMVCALLFSPLARHPT
jgi:predicted exporter